MVAEKLDADLIARNAINRSVLVVRAAEPFNRWAARLDRSRVRRRERPSGGYPICRGHSTHEYPHQITRRTRAAAQGEP